VVVVVVYLGLAVMEVLYLLLVRMAAQRQAEVVVAEGIIRIRQVRAETVETG
jgi:hypothetical protein